MNAEEFLLELYKEEQTHARHTEVQRLEVTKFILVAVGVLVGFMATLKFSIYCLPFGLLTIALGFIGLKVTATYVQRFDDHRSRARAFRSEIDQIVVPAHKAHQILKDHVLDKTDRLRTFWQALDKGGDRTWCDLSSLQFVSGRSAGVSRFFGHVSRSKNS